MATHSSVLAWRIPMDRRVCQATDHGVTEANTTEQLNTSRFIYLFIFWCTVPGSTAIPGRCVEWTEQAPIPTPCSKNPFNILSSDRGRIRY